MGLLEVGISGWNYEGWRGSFYPPKLPHRDELFFASRELPTIEINGTFYALQKPSSYQRWYEVTPNNFIFSVKANRYITHVKRLRDIEAPMARFFGSGILNLKEKLGPILWQFPPSMSFDPDRFETFLKLLPHDFKAAAKLAGNGERVQKNYTLRHAVEVRNYSFLNPQFPDLLRRFNVAIVFADTAGKWPYMEDVTANFIYVRLHGDSEIYTSGYDSKTLDFWSKRIQHWRNGKEPKDRMTICETKASKIKKDVFVYFDNDAKVHAPIDAKSLIQRFA